MLVPDAAFYGTSRTVGLNWTWTRFGREPENVKLQFIAFVFPDSAYDPLNEQPQIAVHTHLTNSSVCPTSHKRIHNSDYSRLIFTFHCRDTFVTLQRAWIVWGFSLSRTTVGLESASSSSVTATIFAKISRVRPKLLERFESCGCAPATFANSSWNASFIVISCFYEIPTIQEDKKNCRWLRTKHN